MQTSFSNQYSATLDALRFVRSRVWGVLAVSAVLLVPCFWHSRIEAGDLGSHTYNAWLEQLIARGQAPGLYLARQWNNVLVDVALTELGNVAGLRAAEKIVVCVAVLIFCWGSFAFITACTGRRPWFLLPGIAMVAYGWTFQMGFLNYYLSLGLAFAALPVFWRGRGWDYGLAGILGVLAFVAHPIGFLWLMAAGVYCKLSERVSGGGRWILFVAAILGVAAMHFYVATRYKAYGPVRWRAVLYTGVDQLVLFGHKYRALAGVVFLIGVASFVIGAKEALRTSEFWRRIRIPLELWVIAFFAVAMSWVGVKLPQYGTGVTFIPDRLTLITAVLGLGVLGSIRLRRWQFVALAVCGLIFFAWMYQDTGVLNNMEQQSESLVSQLPSGRRVIATIFAIPGSRVGAMHMVDRACIERCFLYSNYEPSSRQFRIRVRNASPVAVSRPDVALAMQEGRYIVQADDLPMTEIYQCEERDPTALCMRELTAGEQSGNGGYRP